MIHNLLLSHEYRYSWGLCSMTLIVPLLLMGEVESTGCRELNPLPNFSSAQTCCFEIANQFFFFKFLFVQNYALPHFLWGQATWRTFRICQALQSVLFFFLLYFLISLKHSVHQGIPSHRVVDDISPVSRRRYISFPAHGSSWMTCPWNRIYFQPLARLRSCPVWVSERRKLEVGVYSFFSIFFFHPLSSF